MFKKGILLSQHKLICFFNLENSKYMWQSVQRGYTVCKHLYDISLLFTVSYFLSKVFRKPDDGRNKNLEFFRLFIFK